MDFENKRIFLPRKTNFKTKKGYFLFFCVLVFVHLHFKLFHTFLCCLIFLSCFATTWLLSTHIQYLRICKCIVDKFDMKDLRVHSNGKSKRFEKSAKPQLNWNIFEAMKERKRQQLLHKTISMKVKKNRHTYTHQNSRNELWFHLPSIFFWFSCCLCILSSHVE